MKIYNLLLLSSSNHVQLVNSFKDAYNKLGIKGHVFTADIQEYCASAMVSEKHFPIPRSDSKEFFPSLKKIIGENKINIVLSARDEELAVLSQNREFFIEHGCILIVSNENSINLCRDKYELNNFFKKNDIPHPETHLFAALNDNQNIKYPLICKPRFGKGGLGIYKVYNYNTIQNLIDNTSDYIFQEYIEGVEYTIDVLNDLKGNVLSVIPRKRVLIKGGESIISITEKNDQLINYAKKISEKIGFVGHINIQCIIKDDIPFFLEINPRFGGASNCSFEAGMKSPINIMLMVQGEKIKPFIGEFKDNLMILRYSQDFIIKRDNK
ncbi:MAG: ATP-grasp domain-containing protein [Promethearchaeota archaeon]